MNIIIDLCSHICTVWDKYCVPAQCCSHYYY